MQPGADQRQACDQLAGQTGSGYFCSNGKCLAFCSNRTECSSADRCVGQTFLQQGGVCQTPCGLYDPASCPPGLHCSQIAINTLTSELLPICVAGGTKTETETCVVDAATQNHDCTPGLFCAYADAVATATTCQRLCRAAADCRSDQICKANDPANPAFFSYCSPPRNACVPNPCLAANKHVCTAQDVGFTCACDAGFAEDATGVCKDATPCAPNPCTQVGKTVCVASGLTFTCGCDAGLADDGAGGCKDPTPCDPNPCTQTNKKTCSAAGFTFTCACDAGFAEDASGVCRDATPCDPNPCTQARKTVCTPSGFTFTCGCDSGTIGPGCAPACPGNVQHVDGDALEPNECAAEAYPLVTTPAGSVALAANVATIAPATTDVDYYALTPASHVYWTLLGADAPMCAGISATIDPVVSATYRYAAQSAASLTFSCARQTTQAANPGYRIAVLDFPVAADYASSATGAPTALPPTSRTATNTVGDATDNLDSFTFEAEAPFTVLETGRRLNIVAKLTNPVNGTTLQTLTVLCGESHTPTACINVSGSGVIKVQLTVTPAPEFATTGLTAYQLSW